jgi:hypothetical protein
MMHLMLREASTMPADVVTWGGSWTPPLAKPPIWSIHARLTVAEDRRTRPEFAAPLRFARNAYGPPAAKSTLAAGGLLRELCNRQLQRVGCQ